MTVEDVLKLMFKICDAAHVPLFLYPFLNTTSKTRPFEYLRLTSLGVIGAIVKVASFSATWTAAISHVWLLLEGCELFGGFSFSIRLHGILSCKHAH